MTKCPILKSPWGVFKKTARRFRQMFRQMWALEIRGWCANKNTNLCILLLAFCYDLIWAAGSLKQQTSVSDCFQYTNLRPESSSYSAFNCPQSSPEGCSTWQGVNISKVHHLGLLWWWIPVSPLIYIWAPAALPYLPLISIQSKGKPMLFIEERRTRDFKVRAAGGAHPSKIKGMFLFFNPPLNTRPCII